MNQKGFSLLILLLTVLIIGLLIGSYFFNEKKKQNAKVQMENVTIEIEEIQNNFKQKNKDILNNF